MNADQANAVLREVAEHVLTRTQLIYGIDNVDKAREVIKEALVVDKAAREAKPK
jgi:heptaprenylglyceryl phosphate synthase